MDEGIDVSAAGYGSTDLSHLRRSAGAGAMSADDEGLLPPPPRPAKPKREGWPFTAQYTGVCTGCTDEVRPGDRIVRMDDDTYRHVGACEKA